MKHDPDTALRDGRQAPVGSGADGGFRMWYDGGMRLTMRQRILIAFLAFIAGPTLVALVVTQRVTSSLLENRILLYSSQLTNQVTRAIDAHLVNYRNLTMQVYFNADLLEAVTDTPPADWAREDVISGFLQGFVNSDRYISTAYMIPDPVSMDGAIVQGMPYLGVADFVDRNRERIEASDGRLVWLPTREFQSVFGRWYDCFAAVRPVRSDGEIVALLVLLFREDFFRERYRDVRLESDETTYLVSDDATVVSSSDPARTASRVSPEFGERLHERANGWFLLPGAPDRYVAHSRSRVTDWVFVSEMPAPALFADLVPVRNLTILIAVLFVAFMGWLGASVSRRITSPLRLVQDGIHRIGQGDLSVRIALERDDDIGELASTVNRMAGRLEGLVQRVAEEERERQRDRLRFLQMQLSPHFVYNSLNTIRWMAIINRQENIKAMIDALIQLMKNVASPDAEHTALSREIALLEHYAYIQQMRFPNFQLSVDVPDDLMDARINKFVLQNLVENSIVHGFPDRSRHGRVSVTARVVDGDLMVTVQDDGVGFDPSDRPTPADEEHNHTGLARIQERIALVHGDGYGISVDSSPGAGTTVTVRVPYAEWKENSACVS
tara:strand:- start:133 stop:1965 length:1833 start_codon:yes stop_codon:yes gene_type:complete